MSLSIGVTVGNKQEVIMEKRNLELFNKGWVWFKARFRYFIFSTIFLLATFALYVYALNEKIHNNLHIQHQIDMIGLFVGILCYFVDTSEVIESKKFPMGILRALTFLSVSLPLTLHLIDPIKIDDDSFHESQGTLFFIALILIGAVFILAEIKFLRKLNKKLERDEAMKFRDIIAKFKFSPRDNRKVELAQPKDLDFVMGELIDGIRGGVFSFNDGVDFNTVFNELNDLATNQSKGVKTNFVLFIYRDKNIKEPLGFALLEAKMPSGKLDKHIEIRLFGVAKFCRNKGYGEAFLNNLMAGAGGLPVTAYCLPSAAIMQSMLVKKGFELQGGGSHGKRQYFIKLRP